MAGGEERVEESPASRRKMIVSPPHVGALWKS